MITGRPDFTESAFSVQSGTIQIESGVEYMDFGTHEEMLYPQVLARFGIGENLEIRPGFSGWTNITMNEKSKTYLNDLILEAKYQITNNDAKLPVAILIVSTFPTGNDEVSVGNTEIGMKVAGAYDIHNHLDLGINLGAISVNAENGREILSLVS
jgi:hypothetical protein